MSIGKFRKLTNSAEAQRSRRESAWSARWILSPHSCLGAKSVICSTSERLLASRKNCARAACMAVCGKARRRMGNLRTGVLGQPCQNLESTRRMTKCVHFSLPLGSRERASHGCPHWRCSALPPNFCNRQRLRHPLCPTRPLRLTSAACAPASTSCMRLRLGSRTDPPALPDSPPAPRSDAKHSFLPRNCSAAWPGSGARQPEPLASHALLHGVRSCTSSPELPPVAYHYQIDAVTPTLFGCAANAAGASEAGVLKTQTGERKSFAQS